MTLAPPNLDISWMKSQGYDPSNPSGGVGLAPGLTWQDWIKAATGPFNPVSTSNPISPPTTIPRPANEPVNPPPKTNSYFYNPEDPGEIQWNYEDPIIQEWQRTTQGPYTRQGLKSWMDKRGISVTPPTTIPRPSNEPVNQGGSSGVLSHIAIVPDFVNAFGVDVPWSQWNQWLGEFNTSPEEQPGEAGWISWLRNKMGASASTPYGGVGVNSPSQKPITAPTTSPPTVNKPTTTETPAAVSGPVTPPTWLGNVPSSTAMKFSDPELSLRPLQAGGSPQLFPSFQMPSFNYPASNPRQGSKNWWEMDWG